MFQKRAQILKKKIDASRGETDIFSDELAEIEDQLQVSSPFESMYGESCELLAGSIVREREHPFRARWEAWSADRDAKEPQRHFGQAGQVTL